jgi:hypothetical protein
MTGMISHAMIEPAMEHPTNLHAAMLAIAIEGISAYYFEL